MKPVAAKQVVSSATPATPAVETSPEAVQALMDLGKFHYSPVLLTPEKINIFTESMCYVMIQQTRIVLTRFRGCSATQGATALDTAQTRLEARRLSAGMFLDLVLPCASERSSKLSRWPSVGVIGFLRMSSSILTVVHFCCGFYFPIVSSSNAMLSLQVFSGPSLHV